jgi:glycosyltransferase involved in cell wall biosynthesis
MSDHIDCPSGFGVQHGYVARGLAKTGLWDVHSIGFWDKRAAAHAAPGLTRYPGGHWPPNDPELWRVLRPIIKPDILVTLGDLWMYEYLLKDPPKDLAWFHWLPVDGAPYPVSWHPWLTRLEHLVLMSKFGTQLFEGHLPQPVRVHYVPHGVDTRIFRPLSDRRRLRRAWSARLGEVLDPDDFLLIARDTNQWRKQQPLLLETLSRIRDKRVKLIFHCDPVAGDPGSGWDLRFAAQHVYGVDDRVIFTTRSDKAPSLSREELNELDNLCDLRVSATAGEGFGVITLEGLASGTPSVITDYTTSRELVEDCGELVRVAGYTLQQGAHILRPIADTRDFAHKILKLQHDRRLLSLYRRRGRQRAVREYTVARMQRMWRDLIVKHT